MLVCASMLLVLTGFTILRAMGVDERARIEERRRARAARLAEHGRGEHPSGAYVSGCPLCHERLYARPPREGA